MSVILKLRRTNAIIALALTIPEKQTRREFFLLVNVNNTISHVGRLRGHPISSPGAINQSGFEN